MPSPSSSRSLTALLLCSLSLLGAFLLFQVQPVMSKFILPWFGGSPGVWTTCMLFFQVVLFLGYAYAHALTLLPRRWQGLIHAALALTALAFLPISPTDAWKPAGGEDPAFAILKLLAATVGLPYFVLSSTSPLVQVWFARALPGGRPWRLYALSNAGSLLALLSYPFFFEPRWDVVRQTVIWSAAFVAFVLLSLGGVWRDRGSDDGAAGEEVEASPAPRWWQRFLWVALPAMASIMLLATTNHVCQDVAVIPLMWVAPLSLYLLTFIICFEHQRWYAPALWALPAMALLFLVIGWEDLSDHWNTFAGHHSWLAAWKTNFIGELVACFAAMFLACMVCHGELTRLKPAHSRLTEFYLLMSAGGALGGLVVSLVAPRVFSTYLEWPLGLIGSFLIATVVVGREAWLARRTWVRVVLGIALAVSWAGLLLGSGWGFGVDGLARVFKTFVLWQKVLNSGLVLAAVTLVVIAWLRRRNNVQPVLLTLLVVVSTLAALFMQVLGFNEEKRLEQVRNFYGVISVSEDYDPGLETPFRKLSHGTITHGIQNLGEWREQPITYYGRQTGIGLALETLKNKPGARVGVVGMGAGTVGCYGMPGQVYRFYDINPDIVRLAKKYFTYLDDLEKRGSKLEIVIGDARLSLEREASQQFDVMLLDAFAGDSVPVHLLTREAFEIYKRHLKPDGIIAVHVTNTYLRLAPVIQKVAASLDMKTTRVETDEDGDDYSTDYVLVTNNAPFLAAHPTSGLSPEEARLDVTAWTDKNHSLFRILNRR